MDLTSYDDENAAVDDMLNASALDLGDFFVFRTERVATREASTQSLRFRVHAELGGRPFDTIIVDVGLFDSHIWAPEEVRTPGTLAFAGVPPVSIPVLPMEQQVSEKLHAYTRVYGEGKRSSRIKDLVDLLTIASNFSLDAEDLDQAVRTVFSARETHDVPESFPEPPRDWRDAQFSRLARQVGWAHGLKEAHARVAEFLDPVLQQSRKGKWHPGSWSWELAAVRGESERGEASVQREAVTPAQLLRMLNEELEKDDEMRDCRFVGPIFRLRQPDAEGCNWSQQIVLRGSGVHLHTRHEHIAGEIIEKMAREYNLMNPEDAAASE